MPLECPSARQYATRELPGMLVHESVPPGALRVRLECLLQRESW